MRGLIEAKLSTARQNDGGSDAPSFFCDLCMSDVPLLQGLECCVEIVTHEIEDGAEHGVAAVNVLARVLIHWMDCQLSRWKRKDEPAATGID